MKNNTGEAALISAGALTDGVRVTRTALYFQQRDAATLRRTKDFLLEVDKGHRWWWGDYWCAWVEQRMKELEDADADLAQDHADEKQWVRRAAYEIGQALNGMGLADEAEDHKARWATARFYNPPRRRGQLSNTHHQDAAKFSAGDIEVASKWLDRAAAGRWSMARLRSEMRAESRQDALGADVLPPSDEWDMEFVYGARRWARAHMSAADDIAPDVAAALLRELTPVVEILGKITQKAGKESITPAPPRR